MRVIKKMKIMMIKIQIKMSLIRNKLIKNNKIMVFNKANLDIFIDRTI